MVGSVVMPESFERGIFIHANEDDTCAGTEVVSGAEFGGGGVFGTVTAAGPKAHDLEQPEGNDISVERSGWPKVAAPAIVERSGGVRWG